MDCGGKHPCLPVGWGSPHLQSPRRRCRVRRQVSDDHVSDSPVDERDDSRHDSEGGASPTLRSDRAGLWRSPGRAGFDIVPPMSFRPRLTLKKRGPGAWLSFRREKVPGTAPIALKAARLPPSARSQSSPFAPARPRRWCDAGTPAAIAAADQKAGAPGRPGFDSGSNQRQRSANSNHELPAGAGNR